MAVVLEEGLVEDVRRQFMDVLMEQYDKDDMGRATQMARAINGVIAALPDVPWVMPGRGESGGEINDRAARTQSPVLRLAFLMDHLPHGNQVWRQGFVLAEYGPCDHCCAPTNQVCPACNDAYRALCEDCKAVNPYCTDCPAEPADD